MRTMLADRLLAQARDTSASSQAIATDLAWLLQATPLYRLLMLRDLKLILLLQFINLL